MRTSSKCSVLVLLLTSLVLLMPLDGFAAPVRLSKTTQFRNGVTRLAKKLTAPTRASLSRINSKLDSKILFTLAKRSIEKNSDISRTTLMNNRFHVDFTGGSTPKHVMWEMKEIARYFGVEIVGRNGHTTYIAKPSKLLILSKINHREKPIHKLTADERKLQNEIFEEQLIFEASGKIERKSVKKYTEDGVVDLALLNHVYTKELGEAERDMFLSKLSHQTIENIARRSFTSSNQSNPRWIPALSRYGYKSEGLQKTVLSTIRLETRGLKEAQFSPSGTLLVKFEHSRGSDQTRNNSADKKMIYIADAYGIDVVQERNGYSARAKPGSLETSKEQRLTKENQLRHLQ